MMARAGVFRDHLSTAWGRAVLTAFRQKTPHPCRHVGASLCELMAFFSYKEEDMRNDNRRLACRSRHSVQAMTHARGILNAMRVS